MVANVTKYNVHIEGSWTARNTEEMRAVLLREKALYPDCEVFKHRTIESLVREWRAHNRLYRWGIFKNRAKDVDLEWPQPWWMKAAYFVLGM